MIRDYQDYLADIGEMIETILEFMNGISYETFS